MREIKFRAWDKKQKVMIDWGTDETGYIDITACLTNSILKNNSVLMEFTGLRDNKRTKQHLGGQPIFEGDIIKISTADRNHRIQEVIFKDGAFCGYSDKKVCKYTYLDVLIRTHEVEVIGNIHENPELLTA